MLTRASVHCAERIVATASSSALEWCSAQVASGYSRFSRAMIFRARALRCTAWIVTVRCLGMLPNRNTGNEKRETHTCPDSRITFPPLLRAAQQPAGEQEQLAGIGDGVQSRRRSTCQLRTEWRTAILAGCRNFDLTRRWIVGIGSPLQPHGTEARPVRTHAEDRDVVDAQCCFGPVDEHTAESLRRVFAYA